MAKEVLTFSGPNKVNNVFSVATFLEFRLDRNILYLQNNLHNKQHFCFVSKKIEAQEVRQLWDHRAKMGMST